MAEVLVVDDAEELRAALRMLLEAEGHTVYEAPDGLCALTRLRTHPRPLVVLLDWLMPGLDGIQVLHALAADAPLPTHRHAFILLTAAPISEAHPLPPLPSSQAVQVMQKPFDIDDLLAAIAAAAERCTVTES